MASTTNSMHLAVTAAVDLLDRRDYTGALKYIENYLADPSSSASQRERDLLSAFAGECLAILGRSDDALAIALPLAQTYRPSDAHEVYSAACIALAAAYYFRGELDSAGEFVSSALHAARRIDNIRLIAKSLNWSGNIAFYAGDYPSARLRYRECMESVEAAGLNGWSSVVSLNVGLTSALTGDLADAKTALRACLDGCDAAENKITELRCELVLGFVEIQSREFDAARKNLESLKPHLTGGTYVREQGAWCEYMGELELSCGNLSSAESHLQTGIEIASRGSRDESLIGQSRRLLAEVRLAQGNWLESIAEGELALESIRKVGERFEEGAVYRVFGEACMRIGQHAEARAAFKQSMDILRTIGARLEWAKTCLAAGRCEAFTQRERLAYLVEAERIFGEIGIEYWIDTIRHELKDVLHGRDMELVATDDPNPDHAKSLFVTADPSTIETVRLVERLARTDIAILLTGETGVGKDQLSRLIHAASPRHAGPFLPIDLSTLPETLWESEVFGHRKGAFTGASSDKVGLLESANGGTVFLNEIGNLPKPFQAKLLELLDSNKIRRIGETQPRPLDVRFVAATNVNLREAVTAGRFRADLYYRLAQAPLNLKPLRERRDDILPLLRHFLREFGVPVSELSLLGRQLWVERAINGHWAGNVRQLRSFVHRLVAIADRPSEPDFPGWAERLLEQIDIIHEPNVGARVSRDALLTALERNSWNQRATARDLGITEGGVRHLMRRFEVQRPEAA